MFPRVERQDSRKKQSAMPAYIAYLQLALRLLTITVSLVVATSQLARASDMPWGQLPDGSVLVLVKGTLFRLPSKGDDIDLIKFADRQLRTTMSLKEVVANPADARSLFDRSEQILITFPNLIERHDLFLGQFPRGDFRAFSASMAIGGTASSNCSTMREEYLAFQSKSDPLEILADGWAQYNASARPTTFVFVRPGHDDRGSAMLGLVCDSFASCSTTVCVGNNASFAFKFNKKIYPVASWRALEDRVDALLQYLVPLK